MRKMKLLLLMFILFLNSGCNSINSRFQEFYDSIDCVDEKVNYLVIIPEGGCGGCISNVENFYRKHSCRKELFFVFTNVVSLKKLKQKLNINMENTFIDKENIAMDCYPVDKRIYPCILEVRQKKIRRVYFQSPDEDGLSK